MSSLLARCIGFSGGAPISLDKATTLLHREGGIRRCEARIAVLDYLGLQREDLCEELGLSTSTIDKYWSRIYATTGQRGREATRVWVEQVLRRAIGGEAVSDVT
jgi:hypothetical protein